MIKIIKFLSVFLIITAWLFSGFPRVWQNPRIPQGIEKAFATDTTPTIAGTGANNATVGTKAWGTPEEITVTGGGDDGVYADTGVMAKSEVSNYLKATNFGFAIPDGSTIQGIKVEIDRKEGNTQAAGGIKDSEVKIVKADGTIGATNKANTTDFWPTTEAIAIYGSVSDLWGETWTTTDINDIDFGVVIAGVNTKVSGGGATESAQVDFIRITITYGPPAITVGTTGTQTANLNIPSTNQHVGGAFTFVRSGGTANVTSIVISETGTVNANSNLSNAQIYYKQEVSCSASIPVDATVFNATGVAFNALENATTTGTMTVGTSQICVYVELDVGAGAVDGQTLEIEITNPSTEVTVSAGDVTPATAVAIAGATTLNLPINAFIDHYRWRNDNGPQGNQNQTLYFNPTGNGFGTADFTIVAAACASGSEWDCVDDGTADTQSSAPSSDLETSELTLAAATDYYTLVDDALLAGSTITQLDITVAGADDIGNPNASVTLGYCVVGGANDCGTNDAMGTAQAITGADQTKTEQFTGLSLSTTDLNNMQLVVTGSSNKATISTLYVLVTYSVPEATWKAAEDVATGFTLAKNTNIRLRFQVDNTGGSASAYNYRLEWAAQSVTCDTAYSGESYAAVPDVAGTEHFDMTLSGAPGYVDGEATTAKLSNAESLTFVAGTTVESTSNQSGAITLAQNQYTEVEYVFQANANATDGGVYCFRVTKAGTVLNGADVVAQVTLAGGGASLTFVVSTDVFPNITPGAPVFATSTLSVNTGNAAGWNVTLSGDDVAAGGGTCDLDTDASVNITDLTPQWINPAATTTAGNAATIASGDDVLGFRVMTASGTVSFRASSWWGSTDGYPGSSLWAGIASSTVSRKIGNSSVSCSGANCALNTVLYYLDVPTTQKTGAYGCPLTFTATMN